MPGKSTPANKIKLDPLFQIPEGAEDIFVHSRSSAEPSNADFDPYNVENVGMAGDIIYDSVTDTDATALGVPDVFSIVQQLIHRAPGGAMVVDVVVAIDEVPGADDYDIQVVKV